MKQILKQNILFIILSLLLISVIGYFLLTIPQKPLHLLLNTCHTPTLDIFFRYYTKIAEFAIYIFAVVLLFYKVGDALFVLSAELGIGLIVQIIKRIVAAPRPAAVFDILHNPDALPLVEGVRMNFANSFPSGHTATFVTLFFIISIFCCRSPKLSNITKSGIQILCFLAAFIGAYSRIYLSQHFLADIFAGACLSIVCVPLLYYAFTRLKDKAPAFYNWHISLPKCKKQNKQSD